MKKSLLVALVFAALVAASAFAVTGNVAVTSVATDPVCNGFSNVTVTLQTTAPPPGSAPLDLVIAIDDSGSLSSTDFVREKNAAIAFVNALDFTGGVRKVGVLKFSSNASVIIALSNVKASVINAINVMAQAGGSTNITDAIRDARAMVTGAGSQPGADKVLLLMTDGQANVETAALVPETNAFKALPGEIFALGFGTASLAQLAQIASDPDASHVFMTPDAAQLSALATEIADTIQNPAATNVVLNAIAAAPFSPVAGSNSVTAGTSVPIPGGFRWTIPTLGTETRTLSFQIMHSGNEDGMFAALSTLGGTFVNSDGATQTITSASPNVTVSGCNDAPLANAGADQSVNLSGSPTVSVSLDGSGSSDPDPQDTLTYTWNEGASLLGTGVNPTVTLGLGSHTITLTVSDGRLSDTDDVVITVSDPTPPSVTPNVSGVLGNNNWYTSNIAVSWTVTDAESTPTTSGCGASSVTTDTAGVSFTCSATSAGGTNSATVSVKRDATGPVVGYSGAQATYSVIDTVNITCSATDAMSGLASSTCANVSGPAVNYFGANSFSATAVDNAGNSSTATVSFVVNANATSLCALATQYVNHAGVANSLCVKLMNGSIEAFINEVNAQRGKRLTNAQADTLILIARTL